MHDAIANGSQTPTSTMKEAAPTLADLDAVIARWQALHDTADEFSDDPDMDRSEFAVTLKHLRAYRSLVEAQPSAVPDDYAQRVGQYVTERATQHGWTRDQPEDAFMFMMRRCREVALEDARQPCAVAGLPEQLAHDVLTALECGCLWTADTEAEGRMRRVCDEFRRWAVASFAAPSAVLPLKGEVPTPDAVSGHDPIVWTPADEKRLDDALAARAAKRAAGEGAAAPSVEPTDAELDKVIAATKASYKPTAVSSIELQIARALLAAFARPLPGDVPTGLSYGRIMEIAKRRIGFHQNRPDGRLSATVDDVEIIDFAHDIIAALSAGAPSSLRGERK